MTRAALVRIAPAVFLALIPGLLQSQSLARRIRDAQDSRVAFTFAARRGTCGDGENIFRDGFGGNHIENGNFSGYSHDRWMKEECRPGPVRVVATVIDGEVTRLRTRIGPPPTRVEGIQELGDVSVREATDYLRTLFEANNSRVADQAMLPFVLADSITPWPALLRVARDENRPKGVHQSAMLWLSRGAAYKLGVDEEESPDDEVRASAVFALYNQAKDHAVPQLLDIARTSKRPAVRASALFWLGQSGDPRALVLFDEILR